MAEAPAAPEPPSSTSWDQTEPRGEGAPCYSKALKADLLPGTFVLLTGKINTSPLEQDHNRNNVVARVVTVVSSPPSSVIVNIFKHMKEAQQTEGFVYPNELSENHLRHWTEIVQTTELRVIRTIDIINLSFVFTMASLQDPSNLFSTCQGMGLAFMLRFRFVPTNRGGSELVPLLPLLDEVPDGYCLPFPSSYKNSRYHDCFARRVWHNIISIKMEITKLLGRYSQQQGLFGRERGRLTNVTLETWGFLNLQFAHLFGDSGSGSSTRVRVYRVTESGLVLKAARIKKTCTVWRFETVAHLRQLCNVFGESVTAGQRCRLPKVSIPKTLWKNDIINVVCGNNECEPMFNARTIRDGIDLEYDGSAELFITIRYRRYAYAASLHGCDPLLASLICRKSLHETSSDNEDEDEEDTPLLVGSEFEDVDGCLYRVIGMIDLQSVLARCCYPRRNNESFGKEKAFEILLVKELILQRLSE